MFIRVNQKLCTGCGACVDVCPFEAIRLIDQQAMIMEALCAQCEACITACPNGAITVLLQPQQEPMAITQSAVEQTMMSPSSRMFAPKESLPQTSIKPPAGAVVTYPEPEIDPRLVDAPGKALEYKVTQPKTIAAYQSHAMSNDTYFHIRDKKAGNRGRGKRFRSQCRGGFANTRNQWRGGD